MASRACPDSRHSATLLKLILLGILTNMTKSVDGHAGGQASEDRPVPLSRVAYEGIRDRILDGRIPAGVRLREQDLAEMLDVSRVPVREALPALEAAGFLSLLGRRGVVVPPVSDR